MTMQPWIFSERWLQTGPTDEELFEINPLLYHKFWTISIKTLEKERLEKERQKPACDITLQLACFFLDCSQSCSTKYT